METAAGACIWALADDKPLWPEGGHCHAGLCVNTWKTRAAPCKQIIAKKMGTLLHFIGGTHILQLGNYNDGNKNSVISKLKKKLLHGAGVTA